MGQFTYIAKEKTGKTVKGELKAADKAQAVQIMRQRGLFTLKLEEKKARSSMFSKSVGNKENAKVKGEDLVLFSRQLATLVGAGITIVSALDTLSQQAENLDFKEVLADLKELVNTGSSFSDALSKYENIFSPYFVNMIRAGETSGMLEAVLNRVSDYLEKTHSLQKKIKTAMVYPSIVTSMAALITLLLIMYVIPVFEDMFGDFGQELPLPTQLLINLSHFTRDNFLIIFLGFVGLVVAMKMYGRTEMGHYKIDSMKLKLPIFGQLMVKVAISNFTRTLGTLVKSGVPILSSLGIVSKVVGNDVIEEAVHKVGENVQKGESISGPMKKSGLFPPLVTTMVSVGEKSGQLENMLGKISDFYDAQVDNTVEALTSMIEPLIIAFLGIVIGGIVVAMLLPIFRLTTLVM